MLLRVAPLLASLAVSLFGADLDSSRSEMRAMIERYAVDQASLVRSCPLEVSANRRDRMFRFYRDLLGEMPKLNFEAMSQDGRIDYLLFRNQLQHEIHRLEVQV